MICCNHLPCAPPLPPQLTPCYTTYSTPATGDFLLFPEHAALQYLCTSCGFCLEHSPNFFRYLFKYHLLSKIVHDHLLHDIIAYLLVLFSYKELSTVAVIIYINLFSATPKQTIRHYLEQCLTVNTQ